MWSAFGSGWPSVRITSLVEASGSQEWYQHRSSWPELMFYCLQHTILSFQKYFARNCIFICNPQMPPDTHYTPCQPLTPLTPQYRHLVVKCGTMAGQYDMSSACGSDWCFVRCTPTPSCPFNAPRERHQVAKSGTNLGPVDLSSHSTFYCLQYTVFSFQEYFARDCLHFSYVTANSPWHPLHPLSAPISPNPTPSKDI